MKADISPLKSEMIVFSDRELEEVFKKKVSNIEMAWDEFESKKLNPKSLPFKIIIELTQNCNFKCPMCPQSWEPKFAHYNPELNMPMDLFVKLADELFPTAIFVDLRGFGETTILPYWDDVLSYLERFPLVEWHLVTNLSVPKPQMWDKMMRLGFGLGFSCDGATKETFEEIRKNSRFPVILKNLEAIREAHKKYNKGQLYFISTIQKKNVHELKAIVELAHQYDVREVQFKMVQGHFAPELRAMNSEEIKMYVEEALDLGIKNGMRVTFNDWLFTRGIDPQKILTAEKIFRPKNPNFWEPPSMPGGWAASRMPELDDMIKDSYRVSVNQRCFKPFSFTYINYLGEVGTCNHMMHPNMLVMGDLKNNSIKEIWNCDKYQDFRKQLLNAVPEDSRCKWCFKHRMDD